MKNDFWARSVNVHGLTLAVSADADVWELLESRLGKFPQAQTDVPDVVFEFRENGDMKLPPPTGQTQPIYESELGMVLYAAAQDLLYVNYQDELKAHFELAHGLARVTFRRQAQNLWIATHHLFTILFIEWLKRRGLYSLHAAGLRVKNKGLCLAGSSGAGKSTLALTLVRAGCGLLSDDMVFLKPDTRGVQALAFPEEIDVTDETARLFPELHFLLDTSVSERRKKQVDPQKVYGVETVWECQPAVLIFPTVSGAPKSVLRQIDGGEALLELAPDVLLTEPRASQRHLDTLAALVNQCVCYRLQTGRDFEVLPQSLAELMN